MIDYNPLWQLLDARNIKKTQLRMKAGLSSSTFAKLGKNMPVALNVLVKLCVVLDCQLSDICHVSVEGEGADSYE